MDEINAIAPAGALDNSTAGLVTLEHRNEESPALARSDLFTIVSSFVGPAFERANNLFKSLDPFPSFFVFPRAEAAAVARMPSSVSTSSSSVSTSPPSSFNTYTPTSNIPTAANNNYRASSFPASANDNFARANTFPIPSFRAPPIHRAASNPLFNSPSTPPIGNNPYGPGDFKFNTPLNPYPGVQRQPSANHGSNRIFDLNKDDSLLRKPSELNVPLGTDLKSSHKSDLFSKRSGSSSLPNKPSYSTPIPNFPFRQKFDPLAKILNVHTPAWQFPTYTINPAAFRRPHNLAKSGWKRGEDDYWHYYSHDHRSQEADPAPQASTFKPQPKVIYIDERGNAYIPYIFEPKSGVWYVDELGTIYHAEPQPQEEITVKVISPKHLSFGILDPKIARTRAEQRARDMTSILASLIKITHAFGVAGISIDWTYIHNILSQLSPEVAANVFQTGIAAETLFANAEVKKRYAGKEQKPSSADGDGPDDPCKDAVDAFIKSAGELKKTRIGTIQGFTQCDAMEILKSLAEQCNGQIEVRSNDYHTFKVGNIRVGFHYSATTDIPTVDIKYYDTNKEYKIRCRNE